MSQMIQPHLGHNVNPFQEIILSGHSTHRHKNFSTAGLALWYFIGVCFFSAVYAAAFDIHWHYYKKERGRVNMFIYTIRIPRIVHAMLGIIVAVPIMFITTDLIKDRYLILDMFVAVSGGYLIFDMFARYNEHIHVNEPHGTMVTKAAIKNYLKTQWKLLLQHVVMAGVIYPLILSYRNDQGDFILACILFTELTTPFTELQWIMEHTLVPYNLRYVVISSLAVTTFLCSRLLIVPFVYEAYAIHMNISLYEVLTELPPYYHVIALCYMIPQVYWFCQLCVKIYHYLFEQKVKKDK